MTGTIHEPDLSIDEANSSAHPRHDDSLHEGLTMALYISLSLLAVMVALPSELNPGEAIRPALVIFLTSLGLILAHTVAFRLSTRLLNRGLLSPSNRGILAAQFAGGLAVTVVAVAPVLLFGSPQGVEIAKYLLLGFVCLVGYAAARSAQVSRSRALLYVTTVVLAVLAVIWVKSLVGH